MACPQTVGGWWEDQVRVAERIIRLGFVALVLAIGPTLKAHWVANDGTSFTSQEEMLSHNEMLHWLEYEEALGDRQALGRYMWDPTNPYASMSMTWMRNNLIFEVVEVWGGQHAVVGADGVVYISSTYFRIRVNYMYLYGPTVFRPEGAEYYAGRDGTIVPTRYLWSEPERYEPNAILWGGYIDDHLPFGHMFALNHDRLVEYLVDVGGIPDVIVNITTMGHVYVYTVIHEVIVKPRHPDFAPDSP